MGIHKRKPRLNGGKNGRAFARKRRSTAKKLFSDIVRAWPPKSAGKARDLLNDFSRISSVRAE
ncbi:hypothetical protein BIZ35_08820 [Heyndrickxia coagulans]|uniref:Uncharacterized protein n=1 Tax=Heyndrickxia coagulans TaxID=1398 RepID=A0A133KNK9_HEYCO|nr:hypothetical protein BIZ35_08820 [Heyndrickxia coagulans]KWZ81164.1 hypothetical protein HMPREF3213_02100 [Heyndrickxia coagulans]